MEISPNQIWKEIKGTPLLQQQDLLKHYKGVTIKGCGSLISIESKNTLMEMFFKENKVVNGVFVHMFTYNTEDNSFFYPIIWCYADLSKYPKLSFLNNKHKVFFKGEIKEVWAEEIHVINPEFDFTEDEVPSLNVKEEKSILNSKQDKEIVQGAHVVNNIFHGDIKNNTVIGNGAKIVSLQSNTEKKEENKDIPLWLKYFLALFTVIGILWAFYIYFYPN